jgi:hypothetical protein
MSYIANANERMIFAGYAKGYQRPKRPQPSPAKASSGPVVVQGYVTRQAAPKQTTCNLQALKSGLATVRPEKAPAHACSHAVKKHHLPPHRAGHHHHGPHAHHHHHNGCHGADRVEFSRAMQMSMLLGSLMSMLFAGQTGQFLQQMLAAPCNGAAPASFAEVVGSPNQACPCPSSASFGGPRSFQDQPTCGRSASFGAFWGSMG